MGNYTSISSLVDTATETAREAKGFGVSADRAEATAALALAVKHVGDALGVGLKAIADAITRS